MSNSNFEENPSCQFFIYFAWLCFGIAAVDPFGDDNDSINVKELLHKHVQVRIPHDYFKLIQESSLFNVLMIISKRKR